MLTGKRCRLSPKYEHYKPNHGHVIGWCPFYHYGDVIMGAISTLITSLTVVYSTVYSDADQGNIKAPRHWPLCGEFTGDRWISRTNGQYRGKYFHLMTSSCNMLELRLQIIFTGLYRIQLSVHAFNGDLIIPLLGLGHGWVISSHSFRRIYLLIYP